MGIKHIILKFNIWRLTVFDFPKQYGKTFKCKKCSKCCTRVIPTTNAEIKAVSAYLEEHPELGAKIKKIWNLTPEYSRDFCPFLDLTKLGHKKCLIYNSTVRFKICELFLCGRSNFPPEMYDWMTECLHKKDPALSTDLAHVFLGAKDTAYTKRLIELIRYNF